MKKYKTAYNHLKAFEKDEKYKVTYETINLDFFYKYTTYLRKKYSLSQNTIARDIKTIKVFMGEAVDLGETTNFQFKHKKFSVSQTETDSIYLDENEIFKFYSFDLHKNKRLEQVRDLFVFGCFVGLRFSDYSNIKPENIVNIEEDSFIKIKTQKTGELVIIPCNPVVLEIFKKYDHNINKLPKAPSNQKFNNYIKEAAMLAGLNEKGRLTTQPEKALWECISSHTARRSMATNYYLQGFPTYDLMKITGHKTESAFLKYIKITKLDTAKRLSAHIKKNWSGKLLKVAS
ncbi:MAG: phage integrase SAM-like domain-containing protein [Chitinophagaceae bacterium]